MPEREWTEHLRARLAGLRLNPTREAEIIQELSQHLDQRFEELHAGGATGVEARRLAMEELLEPEALATYMRSLRQANVPLPITPGAPSRFLLGDFWQDLRYAVRMLRKQPGFAAAAVLTLALGLGANIAIFSLVHGLLIRSLPVDRPDELYRLGDTNRCCVSRGLPGSYSLFAFRLFEHLREATSDDFVELAAFDAQSPQPMVVRRGDVAASLPGQYVSANYFQMFGVRPAAGRLLRPEDDRPGAEPVVVISHQAWTQRFGQDSSLVGSSILVYGRPMTVAGVAAQGFFGDTVRPNPATLWIPLGQEPALRGEASLIDRVNQDWLYAIGRLRPGVDPEQAAMRATNALRQWLESQSFLSEEERTRLPRQQVKVVSAGGGVPVLQRQFGQVLTILFITSGLVLLIATANLANLLLARADRGQAAIRAALGASTGRLLRQSVTEGVSLGLVGGFVAIWVAAAGTRALVGLAFPDAQYVPVDTVTAPAVWLFALGLAVVTGAMFSAGPAWFMSRTPPLEALSGVGRSGHVRSFVPRKSLVVTQVALSFVLLSGAGLLANSLGRLEAEELGFEREGRTIVQINPPSSLAGQRERVARLYADMRERLLQIPGVQDASYALYGPMEGQNWSDDISIAGRAVDPASRDSSSWNRIGPRYFETVGTRLMRGRTIEDAEMTSSARVAVINDAFRRRFFENAEPIGQRLGLGGAAHAGDHEIVGIVEDVRYTAPRARARPMIFLPAFHAVEYAEPGDASVQARSMLLRTLIVHASVDPAALEPAIRRAITEVDPDIHVIRVRPYAEQVSLNFRIERLMARLTSTYGLLALLVASIGLYGVTAFTVAQRTREIGVRMALGADRSRILSTVVRGPVGQTLVGLAIGVPLAFVARRLIATQLYGVGSEDPLVFGGATVVLLGSAAIAAIMPALRAASISPTKALRGD